MNPRRLHTEAGPSPFSSRSEERTRRLNSIGHEKTGIRPRDNCAGTTLELITTRIFIDSHFVVAEIEDEFERTVWRKQASKRCFQVIDVS